ncbi:hypothetical protein BDZ88DRAFT_438847 [Geranomyces variabilis]|nr:hypothetical protein BDZ88DRAFT_438847 [Geranomyces variabilis]
MSEASSIDQSAADESIIMEWEHKRSITDRSRPPSVVPHEKSQNHFPFLKLPAAAHMWSADETALLIALYHTDPKHAVNRFLVLTGPLSQEKVREKIRRLKKQKILQG